MRTENPAKQLDVAAEYAAFEEQALRGLDLRPGGHFSAGNSAKILDYINGIDFLNFFHSFSDDEVAEMMLPRAYWHPSGFIRSQLLCGSRDLPEVRLHYWKSDGTAQFDEAIHEHPWDSISIVLQGRVRNEFWSINEGPDYPIVYFETKSIASTKYARIGTCTPTLTSKLEISAGEYYWIPSGTFHRTKLVSDEAVTLFVRGPFLKAFSLIVDENGPAEYSSIKTEVKSADLVSMSQVLRGFVSSDGLRLLSTAEVRSAGPEGA